MITIKLSNDLIQNVNNNYLKAIDIIKFLLKNDNITIKVSSLDFAKSKEKNINNLSIKDLRYNYKDIINAYIKDNKYLVLITK